MYGGLEGLGHIVDQAMLTPGDDNLPGTHDMDDVCATGGKNCHLSKAIGIHTGKARGFGAHGDQVGHGAYRDAAGVGPANSPVAPRGGRSQQFLG